MSEIVKKSYLGFGLSLLVSLSLVWGSWQDMVSIWWRSETFTHCFFIGPFSLYLIWRQRAYVAQLKPELCWSALASLLALSCIYVLAGWVGVGVVQQFLAVLLIPTLVIGWFGRKISSQLAFPLAYLLFMVPFGEALVPYLQDITATMSVRLVEWTGIPVYAEGHYIMLPSGSFQVAEACSGVRYLIASLAVGCLYAWLNYTRLHKRLIFIAVALVLPILANGVRAFGIMMLAHFSGFKLAVGFDHLVYGWLFFGVVIMAMFWLGSLFWDNEPAAPTPMANTHSAASPSYPWLPALALSASLLLLPLAANSWLNQAATVDISAVVLPAQLDQGQKLAQTSEWTSSFQGANRQLTADYQLAGRNNLSAFLAIYSQHDDQHRMIRSTHALFNWQKAILLSSRTVAFAGGVAREDLLMEQQQRVLYWTWYSLGGAITASPVEAKLLQLRARLRHQPLDLTLGLRQFVQDDQQLLQAQQQFTVSAAELTRSIQSQLAPVDIH